MKTSEFEQTIRTTLYLSSKINNLIEIIPFIDEARKYHKKLQDKLEYLLIDPISYESSEEKEKINAIAIEIKNICKQVDIQCGFIKLPSEHINFSSEFRSTKSFAQYSYKGVNITGLIVYSENKRVKKTKQDKEQEIIDELKVVNFEVVDENGNDLNKLPGLE